MEYDRQIEDMKLTSEWKMLHQMLFIYEIATEHVKHLLPSGIEPVEAMPGIGLVEFSYNHYAPGNIIYGEEQPIFYELTRSIVVQPDLSIDMPIPRFAFFVDRIASNNKIFVKHEFEKLNLPAYYSPTLKVGMENLLGHHIIVSDEHGKIREMVNSNPNVIYREDEFYGQYFTVQDQKLYFGCWAWKGKIFTHQSPGYSGSIYNHPYLTESNHEIRGEIFKQCYMQSMSDFNHFPVLRFYESRFIRTI